MKYVKSAAAWAWSVLSLPAARPAEKALLRLLAAALTAKLGYDFSKFVGK